MAPCYNKSKEAFNRTHEHQLPILNKVVPPSLGTTGSHTDSTDTFKEADVYKYFKSRAIDGEHQNVKLEQITSFDDLLELDLIYQPGVVPIEKVIKQPVFVSGIDLKLQSFPLMAVQGGQLQNGIKIFENSNVNHIVKSEGKEMKTKRSPDIKALQLSPKFALLDWCQHGFINVYSGKLIMTIVTPIAGLYRWYVQNYQCKIKVHQLPNRRGGPVTLEKRKQCKKKDVPSVVGFDFYQHTIQERKNAQRHNIIAFLIICCLVGTVKAECTTKYNSSTIQAFSVGDNLLLQCVIGCEQDECPDGGTRWEGGPKTEILTHGNSSSNPLKYLPVRRNQTFDLKIINANLEDFNSNYICYQQFECLSAYLPDIPIRPTNVTEHDNFENHIMLEVDVIGIYPVPDITAFWGVNNLTSFVNITSVKKDYLYNMHISLKYRPNNCLYEDRLAMKYQLKSAVGFIFDRSVILNTCSNSSLIAGIAIPLAVTIVIAIVVTVGVICKCRKKYKKGKNADDKDDEDQVL